MFTYIIGMSTTTAKEFYRQFGKKIYTKIGKEIISLSKADKEDKENHPPNGKNKQKPFHFSGKHLTGKQSTLKKVSHPKGPKGLKGGKNTKTQKRRRGKSNTPMK